MVNILGGYEQKNELFFNICLFQQAKSFPLYSNQDLFLGVEKVSFQHNDSIQRCKLQDVLCSFALSSMGTVIVSVL